MLRRARVPVPAATAAALPRGGPLPKAEEAPASWGLRVLYRAAVDAVLYVSLAALWGHNCAGPVVEILGRWVCGKGSSAEAAGLAIRACSKFVMLASNQLVTMESANEQLPKKKGVPPPRLPKGVKLAPLYGFLPMFLLQFLAIMMLFHHEEGSLMWRAAVVLFDIARLGIGIITGVWAVPNLVILVRVPKAKGEDDKMQ